MNHPFAGRLATESPTGFSMALYGGPGAWKTTLMRSLPDEETVYVPIEGGEQVLKGRCNPVVRRPRKPAPRDASCFRVDMDQIYNDLRFTQHNIHYVVIDSATEIEKYYQLGLCHAASKSITSLAEYGGGADLTYKTIVEFRDLKISDDNVVKRPIHTIFICGEFPLPIEQTESRTITMTYPMLTKKMALKLAHLLDIIAHLEVRTDDTRLLRVRPTERIAAKSRYASLRENIANITSDFSFYESVVKPILADINTNQVLSQQQLPPQPTSESATAAAEGGKPRVGRH